MVEEARLESVYTGNRIEGSNPSVSAFSLKYFGTLILLAITWQTILACLVLAAVFFFCLFKVIIAFKKGYISYGGNRPPFESKKYYKEEDNFMYWLGVILFSIPLIIFLFIGLALANNV